MSARTTRRLALAALLAAAVAVVVVLARGGDDERTLRAAFDSANNTIPGLEVRAAGRQIGEISEAERVGDHAQLTLTIDDDDVWPLPRGTTARLRHGTALGYTTRYVELVPGPRDAPPLRDGALLTAAATDTPIEIDDVFKILDRDGREQLRGYLAAGDEALRGRGRALGRGIGASAGGFDALAGLMSELEREGDALSTLVDAGARTTAALDRRRVELGDWVAGVAETYDELVARTRSTTTALERLPGTLTLARGTLRRGDTSLAKLATLSDELAPGARELTRLAPSADAALMTLHEVAPLATSTLRRGTTALPPIRRLLRRGTPFIAQAGRVFERATPMMDCLRPYAPELAGFLATWAAVGKNYDADGHHTRTLVQVPPYPYGTPLSSKAIASLPGVEYAFPRPPGYNAGQPWFRPECGVGRDALDPSKDPEAR